MHKSDATNLDEVSIKTPSPLSSDSDASARARKAESICIDLIPRENKDAEETPWNNSASSNGSSPSELRRLLQDLPSPKEVTRLADRVAALSRRIRRNRDVFLQFQGFASRIEEKDEKEDEVSLKEPKPNARARRRSRIEEKSRNSRIQAEMILTRPNTSESITLNSSQEEEENSRQSLRVKEIRSKDIQKLEQNLDEVSRVATIPPPDFEVFSRPNSTRSSFDSQSSIDNKNDDEKLKGNMYRSDFLQIYRDAPAKGRGLQPISPFSLGSARPTTFGGYRPQTGTALKTCNANGDESEVTELPANNSSKQRALRKFEMPPIPPGLKSTPGEGDFSSRDEPVVKRNDARRQCEQRSSTFMCIPSGEVIVDDCSDQSFPFLEKKKSDTSLSTKSYSVETCENVKEELWKINERILLDSKIFETFANQYADNSHEQTVEKPVEHRSNSGKVYVENINVKVPENFAQLEHFEVGLKKNLWCEPILSDSGKQTNESKLGEIEDISEIEEQWPRTEVPVKSKKFQYFSHSLNTTPTNTQRIKDMSGGKSMSSRDPIESMHQRNFTKPASANCSLRKSTSSKTIAIDLSETVSRETQTSSMPYLEMINEGCHDKNDANLSEANTADNWAIPLSAKSKTLSSGKSPQRSDSSRSKISNKGFDQKIRNNAKDANALSDIQMSKYSSRSNLSKLQKVSSKESFSSVSKLSISPSTVQQDQWSIGGNQDPTNYALSIDSFRSRTSSVNSSSRMPQLDTVCNANYNDPDFETCVEKYQSLKRQRYSSDENKTREIFVNKQEFHEQSSPEQNAYSHICNYCTCKTESFPKSPEYLNETFVLHNDKEGNEIVYYDEGCKQFISPDDPSSYSLPNIPKQEENVSYRENLCISPDGQFTNKYHQSYQDQATHFQTVIGPPPTRSAEMIKIGPYKCNSQSKEKPSDDVVDIVDMLKEKQGNDIDKIPMKTVILVQSARSIDNTEQDPESKDEEPEVRRPVASCEKKSAVIGDSHQDARLAKSLSREKETSEKLLELNFDSLQLPADNLNKPKRIWSENSGFVVYKAENIQNAPLTSSSTSRLNQLIDTSKESPNYAKRNLDRFPFTISEKASTMSMKCKTAAELDQEFPNERKDFNKQPEVEPKLHSHPSITRLAIEGVEESPSQIIKSFTRGEKERKAKKRGFIKKFSFKKSRKLTDKNEATLLYKNKMCGGSTTSNCSQKSGDESLKVSCTINKWAEKRDSSMQISSGNSLRKKESCADITLRSEGRGNENSSSTRPEEPNGQQNDENSDQYSLFLAKSTKSAKYLEMSFDKILSETRKNDTCDNEEKPEMTEDDDDDDDDDAIPTSKRANLEGRESTRKRNKNIAPQKKIQRHRDICCFCVRLSWFIPCVVSRSKKEHQRSVTKRKSRRIKQVSHSTRKRNS